MIRQSLPHLLGAHVKATHVECALHGPQIDAVEIVIYHPDTQEELKRVAPLKRIGGVWLWHLPLSDRDKVYLYYVTQADGESRFISDPYAKALTHAWYWDAKKYQQTPQLWFPKAYFEHRQRGVSTPLQHKVSPQHRVIYETHVKSISMRHPEVPKELRGTYLGLCQAPIIKHLHELGVTTIQLMPVMAFMPEPFITEKGMTNYWGYNPASFFAPDPRYAYQDAHSELQTCINTLHKAGFEVILDVVFNHTAEGGVDGPTLHFRALNPDTAYTLDPDTGHYANYSGCGNTLNLSSNVNIRLCLDAARHWCEVYGIDGFRYDLATNLGRQPHAFSPKAGLLRALLQDPILRDKIHIAEPWDIGDYGYQLGNFPVDFAEINDQFRDVTRAFWRGDKNIMARFATCMFGSRDVFAKGLRASYTSINPVTCHDGFTLHDLVSYSRKHNEANGEDNRDGHNHNGSHNYGVEGPTDDVVIQHLRERQKRNLFASMIFAQGTPAMLGGDELSRTQQGNNNAYCQDNDINYCQWDLARREADFLQFCRYCIALKQDSVVLTNAQLADDQFLSDVNVAEVNWFKIDGSPKSDDDWHDPNNRGFAVELVSTEEFAEHWLLCVNADTVDHNLVLPPVSKGQRWQVVLDTRMTDFRPTGLYIAKQSFVISNRSFVIFKQEPVA